MTHIGQQKHWILRLGFFIVVVFFRFFAFSQFSYSFMSPLPPESERHQAVDQQYFGIYEADSSGIVYEFNAAGVFTRSLSVIPISRSLVRETSTYRVSGDYIYGLKENDSLPFVLEGENYFVGIPRRDTIVGINSKNELRKVANGAYILNFYENETYIPCLLKFNSGKLSLHFFDYMDEQAFKTIRSQQSKKEEDLTYVYLLPTLKEWKKMDSSFIFGKPSVYVRQPFN